MVVERVDVGMQKAEGRVSTQALRDGCIQRWAAAMQLESGGFDCLEG